MGEILNAVETIKNLNNMKKTITINISGTVFSIDEDAYDKLKNYLTRVSDF